MQYKLTSKEINKRIKNRKTNDQLRLTNFHLTK